MNLKNEKTEVIVKVQMLGGLNLYVDGSPLSDKSERSKQLKSLLAYLLIRRFDHVSQERLIQVLWPEENSDNPANALKNLIYRLRQLLIKNDLLKDIECINCKGGTYSWNNEITCTIDAEELDNLCKEAADLHQTSSVRIEKYLKALNLYKGGFLSDFCYDEWVIPLTSYYQNIYMTCLYEAVQLLILEERYNDIVNICEQALANEPYEESIHEILLKALVKLGKKNKALEHYEYISQKFYKDLGVKLSQSIRDLHKELVKSLNNVETDLSVIKDELQETNQFGGAFFCDYEIFKHLFRLEARTAERAGQSVFICLMTIAGSQTMMPTKEVLLSAMERLKEVVMKSLRKGDVFSRFSTAQYVLMLPTTSYENGEMVLNRILDNFKKAYKNPNIKVKVTLEPIVSAV